MELQKTFAAGRVIVLLAALLATCSAFVASATAVAWGQNPGDSLRISDSAAWRVVEQREGLLCREYRGELFGVRQKIYMLELNPSLYHLAIDQFAVRERVSVAARRSPAEPVAAINGGYFITGIKQAIPADPVRVGGIDYPHRGGWSSTALAPRADTVVIAPWSADLEGDVIVAGPLLVVGGRPQLAWVDYSPKTQYNKQQLHDIFAPRSAIGVRPNGSVALLLVDGRRAAWFGMSLDELATIGYWLGLDRMINLDGGGSSTLWLRSHGVVNSPSDGKSFIHLERKVANMVMVVPRITER